MRSFIIFNIVLNKYIVYQLRTGLTLIFCEEEMSKNCEKNYFLNQSKRIEYLKRIKDFTHIHTSHNRPTSLEKWNEFKVEIRAVIKFFHLKDTFLRK